MPLSVSRRVYDDSSSVDGSPVYEYTLSNEQQMTVKLISLGCTLTSVCVPDKESRVADVVLGFSSLTAWQKHGANFNSVVGRYANRINKGRFTIGGKEYQLDTNNGENHLHGGKKGFYSKNWKEEKLIQEEDRVGVTLTYVSPDGDEGYPGEMIIHSTITLTQHNALILEFKATTTKETIVNICNHAYWNLSGNYNTDILEHRLTLNADHCTPITEGMIPTGEIQPVKGTHHDFTSEQSVGERIHVFKHVDKGANGGYDHNYVLSSSSNKTHPDVAAGQVWAATLRDTKTGRVMDVYTTAPGIQVYTGNFLDGRMTGKEGRPYNKHAGVCLETQTFPNSPNEPSFPSPILQPGQLYHHTVTHVFSIDNK